MGPFYVEWVEPRAVISAVKCALYIKLSHMEFLCTESYYGTPCLCMYTSPLLLWDLFMWRVPFIWSLFMYNYSLCIKDSPHAPPTLHKKDP